MKRKIRRAGGVVIVAAMLLLALLPAFGTLAAPEAWYTGIFVSKAPNKTTYAIGEAFDGTGMEISGNVQRPDGSTAVYRLGNARYSTAPFTRAGKRSVTITCSCITQNGEMKDFTTSVPVMVQKAARKKLPAEWVEDISVWQNPYKMTYSLGERFDPTGLSVVASHRLRDITPDKYLDDCTSQCYYSHGVFNTLGTNKVIIYCDLLSDKNVIETFTTTLKVTVEEPGESPVFSTGSILPDGKVGESYSFYIKAQGTKGITYGEYYNPGSPGKMPDGLRLSSSGSGRIKGTPTKAGTFTFWAYAANDYGEDYKRFTITIKENVVAPAPAPIPIAPPLQPLTPTPTPTPTPAGTTGASPVFSTGSILPDGKVGERYSYYIKAQGTKGITYGEYYNPGSPGKMPDGLRLSGSGSGHVKGTPTKAGTFSFWAYAANDYGEDYKQFTITIKSDLAPATPLNSPGEEGTPPIFTTERTLPQGKVGTSYSYYIKAQGTKGITYEEYDNPGRPGAMPDGLRLSSSGSGHIKGTPTKAGTFTFWASAANDYGEHYKEFAITIE